MNSFDLFLTAAWSKYSVTFDRLSAKCDKLLDEANHAKGVYAEDSITERLHTANYELWKAIHEFSTFVEPEYSSQIETKICRLYSNLHKGVNL